MAITDYLREKVGVPSKLEKLTLVAYASIHTPLRASGNIIAAFNPESITFSNQVNYDASHPVDSPQPRLMFQSQAAGQLNLTLIFDAQQKSQTGSVDEQILYLRTLCMGINKNQETNYLALKWGKMRWSATRSVFWRTQSLTVRFTLFDRDGTPLRAEAELQMIPVPNPNEAKQGIEEGLTSKVIKDNDLLPVLAATVGTQSDYLIQARENVANSINLPKSSIGSTLVLRKKWI